MDDTRRTKTETGLVGLVATGLHNIIDRIFRETGPYQWLRELFQNSCEAGATRILVGIEWQAVEAAGVYRRLFADDGKGMNSEELMRFFRTLGEGGKPVGGRHENFAVGSKVSLLLWNKYGMVVISYQTGQASMIWLKADPETGEYGIRRIRVVDPDTGLESSAPVYEPFDDPESGCDWRTVAPEWLRECGHGTVVVLLGDEPNDDTVLGSPYQEESAIKGASKYLNSRYLELDHVDVVVEELNAQDKSKWPGSEEETRRTSTRDAGAHTVNRRHIRGARHFVHFPATDKGKVASTGTIVLSDGTTITHVLWEGERPEVGDHAQRNGYIAVAYRNELYHLTSHHYSFRSFGIVQKDVRRNLTVIIEPLEATDEGAGVYPGGDRNRLLMRSDSGDGEEIPVQQWGAEWAENMPDDVREAIRRARGTSAGSIEDAAYKDRLAEKFGDKWKSVRIKISRTGDSHTDADSLQTGPSGPGGTEGGSGTGAGGGAGSGGNVDGKGKRQREYGSERPRGIRGRKTRGDSDIPDYRWESAEEFEEGIMATWSPLDPQCPAGVVLLNQDHPVVIAELDAFKDDYGPVHAEDVERIVKAVYGEVAVSKVAHSEHLKALIPSDVVEERLRSDYALTMSLLGLVAEENLVADRLQRSLGRGSSKAA